jgi:hypothetical protein
MLEALRNACIARHYETPSSRASFAGEVIDLWIASLVARNDGGVRFRNDGGANFIMPLVSIFN